MLVDYDNAADLDVVAKGKDNAEQLKDMTVGLPHIARLLDAQLNFPRELLFS
jgi:hypothetical protein